jgi:hypothetical protein
LRTVDKVALETKEQMSQPRNEKMDKTVKKKDRAQRKLWI